MARLPRIVIPGQALHLIQRGNNRQPTFYADEDYCRKTERKPARKPAKTGVREQFSLIFDSDTLLPRN